MKEKFICFVLLFLLAFQFSFAQEKTVTGTVQDKEGVPLPGVTVIVKGTTRGVATDFDGRYSIKVRTGDVLHFESIGFANVEKIVGSSAIINITMQEEAQQLGEVVVTAMGVSRSEKSLGYATQKVKSDDLTQAANTNVATALQGKVSGVEISSSSGMPGSSSKITIRGARSFTGNNTPLYVIDGMPIASTADIGTGDSVTGSDYANRALDIDPNDIQDIQILKGQAASALYGMRASNGVILITTKSGKGKIGKPEFNFNTSVSFEEIATQPKVQTEYAQGAGGRYAPTTSLSWGPKISELPNDPTYGGNTVNRYTNAAGGLQTGKYYVPQRANAGLDPWATPQVYDNIGDFFRTGHTINHSFSISQGLERANYQFSVGNTSTKGIVPSTEMQRTNVKMGGDLRLTDRWTTGFTGNFIMSDIAKQTGANNGIVATVFPAPSSYDLKGIPSHYLGNPYRQNNYRGGAFDNAYWAVENNSFTEKTARFFGNGFLKYGLDFNNPNHKVDLKYQLGLDSYTTKYEDVWGYGHSNQLGEITAYKYSVREINSLFTANYIWKISDSFSFDALLGNEIVDRETNYLEAYGKDFNFPGWNHMKNVSTYIGNNTENYSRTVGFFGNANLAFKSIVFLGVTGRQDVVSTMPRGNRTFFYPSTSLGVILTEIPALKNDILTFAKLRASYAEVGQAGDYIPNYFSTPTYEGGFYSGNPITYPYNGIKPYTFYRRIYDANLKPQNTKSYEVGADLTFADGLVDLSYTYSRQNVKDQIFSVPLAGSTGSYEYVTNGGAIHTDVHEATLNIAPIRKDNVKWNIGFNFSKIDNYVDELAEGVESIFLGGFVEPQVRAGIGYRFPVIYGTSYLRNDAGKIIVDDDGLPLVGEEKVIGTVSPDFKLGFSTTLEVHKVKLSAVFDWKSGGQMYHGTAGLMNLYGMSQLTADIRNAGGTYVVPDAVKQDGTANDIAANAYNYFSTLSNISESYVVDASFVKLREISLSYPFVLKDKGFSVTANIFARNLILWSALEGFDPEVSQGNTNMAGAFERFSLPGVSSYGVGLNIKF